MPSDTDSSSVNDVHARLLFIVDVLSRLLDPTNRALYQSCLQDAMSIIASLIDYQVEHLKQNTSTPNNPFASKLLIKVCLDYLLQNVNNIKAPVCVRCLTSLAKVTTNSSAFLQLSFNRTQITPGLSILLESNIERFRTFILKNIQDRKVNASEQIYSTERISSTSRLRMWPWLFWTF